MPWRLDTSCRVLWIFYRIITLHSIRSWNGSLWISRILFICCSSSLTLWGSCGHLPGLALCRLKRMRFTRGRCLWLPLPTMLAYWNCPYFKSSKRTLLQPLLCNVSSRQIWMLTGPSEYTKINSVPNLKADCCLLVDLYFLREVLDSCGHLVVVRKFIMHILKQ